MGLTISGEMFHAQRTVMFQRESILPKEFSGMMIVRFCGLGLFWCFFIFVLASGLKNVSEKIARNRKYNCFIVVLLFSSFLWHCWKTVTCKGYNILVLTQVSERVEFRTWLCLWTVPSTWDALMTVADRLQTAFIPQWQIHQDNLGRCTCVPAAPAPAVTMCGEKQCVFIQLLFSAQTSLISASKF